VPDPRRGCGNCFCCPEIDVRREPLEKLRLGPWLLSPPVWVREVPPPPPLITTPTAVPGIVVGGAVWDMLVAGSPVVALNFGGSSFSAGDVPSHAIDMLSSSSSKQSLMLSPSVLRLLAAATDSAARCRCPPKVDRRCAISGGSIEAL
jgi:hypothetical protein